MRVNEHGQPVGDPVDWRGVPRLAPVSLEGRWVRLEPLGVEHARDLYDATCGPDRERVWTYTAADMPASAAECASYLAARAADPATVTLAVRPRGKGVQGLASWMRMDPGNGSVEVGGIVLGPPLQRTTAATEAMFLMARHAFEHGYRRYEWKCDALNAPSRAAAVRLGFTYEGTFRQALVHKGRNRDTAWYSITDREWPAVATAFARWLDPANFDDPGAGTGQRTSLADHRG